MALSGAPLGFLFVFQSIFIKSTVAVTCFGVNGLAYADNVICPGSNACCGSTATCLPNRLCHNQGDNNDTFVRGPCAITPYTVDSCAEICVYNETAADGGLLPRVTIWTDGSYCCNDIPACCEDGEGVFLDSTGDIVASLPSTSNTPQPSTSSSSSLSSPTSSSTSIGPGTASATATDVSQTPSQAASRMTSIISPSSSPSYGLSTGAKVGLGIGIPLGIIAVGGLAITVWLQQKRLRRVEQGIAARPDGAPPNPTL